MILTNYMSEFEKYGFYLKQEEIEKFCIYLSELMFYKDKINLTSHSTEEDIVRENFLDSLTCLQAGKKFKKKKIIDIGTGAGFPGLPVKIVTNSIKLYLLESTRKKIKFLERLIDKLSLSDTYILPGRAEEFAIKENFRGSFDMALARGVANLTVLIEYGLPFLKLNGIFIAQKGRKFKEEIDLSQRAMEILGGNLLDIKNVTTGNTKEEKKLILIQKISPTPDKYPRRPGMPSKRPLF